MRIMTAVILGLVGGFGCAARADPTTPTRPAEASSETPARGGPNALIPATLDPAIQKQAASVLDADTAVSDRAGKGMLERKTQAIAYLLEICLDDAGMPRRQVAPLLGTLILMQTPRGSTVAPAASKILHEARTHPSAALRRGAVAWLLLEATSADDPARSIAALKASAREDKDERVRGQAKTTLHLIAVDVLGNRVLAPDATEPDLVGHYKTLETIGEPALAILTKFSEGAMADLDNAEQLRRIRRGIGGDDTPELLGQIALYRKWVSLSSRTIEAIRSREKAEK